MDLLNCTLRWKRAFENEYEKNCLFKAARPNILKIMHPFQLCCATHSTAPLLPSSTCISCSNLNHYIGVFYSFMKLAAGEKRHRRRQDGWQWQKRKRSCILVVNVTLAPTIDWVPVSAYSSHFAES